MSRTRSLPVLILVGFGAVALPLILALGYVAVHVDRLAQQSRHSVYQAVSAVKDSRRLIEQTTTMERNARQYLILQDPALLEAYRDTHARFQTTVARLRGLPLNAEHRAQLEAVTQAEAALYERLGNGAAGLEQGEVSQRFATLTDQAQNLMSQSHRMIDREVRAVHGLAERTYDILFWLALSLIPLSLILAGVFTMLILRPVRQVNRAIRRLGEGGFEVPVTVTGPQDLRAVGQQLEWLRQRLQALEEQKTRFLQHVSHELKTPLAAIREGGELLGDRVVGPLNDEQAEIVRIVHTNTQRLQRLIEDLIGFSTVHASHARVERTRVDLADLLSGVLDDHKPAVLAQALVLETLLEPATVSGDAQKLRSALDNIVANAVKFSPEGGRISVSLRAIGRDAVIDVTDQGPGIAPGDRARIFDPFFRGAKPDRGDVAGSGLGLAMAKEYVEAHRGAIEIIDHDGAGAHVRVTLPLSEQGVSRREVSGKSRRVERRGGGYGRLRPPGADAANDG